MIRRKRLFVGLTLLVAVVCFAGDGWVVRQDGIGPVKVGISLPQLNTALQEKFAMPQDKEDQWCFYVTSTKHPQVSFMIENGRLVRIDVDKRGVATADGAQVGDSEEHVKEVYGSNLKVEPRAYMDDDPHAHYLTLRSGDYGIRFETDGGKVSSFYAGTFEAIQYIEGCQ